MAYQTNSEEFFDLLHKMLIENKVTEVIRVLSDATSSDATLHGDLKFLKLRANKKLMVPAGGVGGPPKDQIRDVIKLINELKNAHSRRKVMVSTLTDPSSKGGNIFKQKKSGESSDKKRAVWPWVLLFLLLGGSAAGYFFKDKILQNEMVQKVIPEGFLSNDKSEKAKTPVKNTSNSKPQKKPASSSKKKTSTPKPSSKSLGRWYIQIASYPTLKQALDKRKRVEMSFDRSVVLQKNISGKTNYRVVIPGFSDKKAAENFKKIRKVNKLHIGAFAQAFDRDCRDLAKSESNIFICK